MTNTDTAPAGLPPLPLTIEGSSVLHQMFRIHWAAWNSLEDGPRKHILDETVPVLQEMEQGTRGESAIFSLLGHKGDLMLVHYRHTFDELNEAELKLARTRLSDYLQPAGSYVSVVELGLYKSTVSLYRSLLEKNVPQFSEEWIAAIEDTLQRQREAMRPRLYPAIPPHRYISFYPMNRRRGEEKNWYELPIAERQRQMEDHGSIGQRYAGKVKQIISGSIGLDDWEWGVDLFSDDPLIFKKLIYEMRFDEVSAAYSDFGTFYVGIRCPAADLPRLLDGEVPGRTTDESGTTAR